MAQVSPTFGASSRNSTPRVTRYCSDEFNGIAAAEVTLLAVVMAERNQPMVRTVDDVL